jgi:hypothetical protein
MPTKVYQKFGDEPLVKNVFSNYQIKIVLYKTDAKEKITWLK